MKELLNKFGLRGSFFRTAFSKFSSKDLVGFFESRGLEFKVEDGGRVFPITDDSKSILKILELSMKKNGVKTVYNAPLQSIKKPLKLKGIFKLNGIEWRWFQDSRGNRTWCNTIRTGYCSFKDKRIMGERFAGD